MISVKASGSTPGMEKSLYKMQRFNAMAILNKGGQQGVDLLAAATPVDSGLTADSWEYEVQYKNRRYSIIWSNTNENSGVPIAVIIQYGHGTGTGGYVDGIDYINPAMRPIFEKIAADIWEEVKNA